MDAVLGNYDQARASAETALAMARRHGRRDAITHASVALAEAAIATGEYAQAEQVLQSDSSDYGQISFLAYAACGQGRVDLARQHICTALRIEIEQITQWGTAAWNLLFMEIPAAALLSVHRGEMQRAVELYALALRDPRNAKSQWIQDVVGQPIAAAAAALPPAVVAAAQERGRARDWVGTAKELLAELCAGTEGKGDLDA
jgi:hypothetical protein